MKLHRQQFLLNYFKTLSVGLRHSPVHNQVSNQCVVKGEERGRVLFSQAFKHFFLFAKDSGFNINNNIVEILIPQLQLQYFHYEHMQFVKPVSYTHLTLPTKLEV